MGDPSLNRVCVFCGSAVGARPEYAEAATALAGELGRRGLGLVYGGGSVGLLRLPALRNALVTNGAVMAGLDLYNLYFPVYARGIGLPASTIGLVINFLLRSGAASIFSDHLPGA